MGSLARIGEVGIAARRNGDRQRVYGKRGFENELRPRSLRPFAIGRSFDGLFEPAPAGDRVETRSSLRQTSPHTTGQDHWARERVASKEARGPSSEAFRTNDIREGKASRRAVKAQCGLPVLAVRSPFGSGAGGGPGETGSGLTSGPGPAAFVAARRCSSSSIRRSRCSIRSTTARGRESFNSLSDPAG